MSPTTIGDRNARAAAQQETCPLRPMVRLLPEILALTSSAMQKKRVSPTRKMLIFCAVIVCWVIIQQSFFGVPADSKLDSEIGQGVNVETTSVDPLSADQQISIEERTIAHQGNKPRYRPNVGYCQIRAVVSSDLEPSEFQELAFDLACSYALEDSAFLQRSHVMFFRDMAALKDWDGTGNIDKELEKYFLGSVRIENDERGEFVASIFDSGD